MNDMGLTLRGCYLSPKELVRRAIARGDIIPAAPVKGTTPVNKGVWSPEARERKRQEQLDRREKLNDKIRASWTPERRARQSQLLRAIHRGTEKPAAFRPEENAALDRIMDRQAKREGAA